MREGYYLRRWLNINGLRKNRKFKGNTNGLVNLYEEHLTKENVILSHFFTSAERYKAIAEYLEFHIETKPKYKKMLKGAQLTSAQLGYILGYKAVNSWSGSLKHFRLVKAYVSLVERTINSQFK